MAHGSSLLVCSHYSRRSLTRGNADERTSIAREIPSPCHQLLIGSLWADGSWYEAVCRSNPDPVAYVFSFRPAISYAEATDVLAGCADYGVSRATVGAALWARCADGVAVATRSHRPENNQVLHGVTREIACRQGRPMLRAVNAEERNLRVIEGRCSVDQFVWASDLRNAPETIATGCDESTR